MSERRPSNSGRPGRGSGPRRSGDSRPGSFSRGPRRDDDRGSRGPRRDDGRPPRDRDDRRPSGDRDDRPRRFDRDSRPPRSGDDRPRRFDRDSRPPRDRDDRPRSFDRDSRPPRDGGDRPRRFDRDSRPPRDRDDRPRSFDRDSRSPRFDRDSRPPRDGGDRPRRFDRDSRPPRDGDDRPRRFDRDSRPPRDGGDRPRRFDRDSRPPRDRDDRPRSFDRDSRPPRDGGDRPRRFDRDDRPRRFDRDSRPPRDRDDRPRSFDRDDRPRRFDRDDRPRRFDRDDRPRRFDRDDRAPRTAAQERSDEVRGRIGERRTSGEMSSAPERSREEWIDEGSVRPKRDSNLGGVRAKGTGRAQKGGRKEVRALDSVVEQFERALGKKASPRALKRYEAALQAFEAHRYEDARKILNPMSREYSDVSAVREMLGLCFYRAGQWKRAVTELETAIALNPDWIFNHAVLADCHRALGDHEKCEKYWRELAEASPHPELLAEGRIVMAGSLADRGLVSEALSLMDKAAGDMKRPSEYHLRQWFVIGDLYDKEGNVIKARQFFERVAMHDRQFVDVAERLASLGG